VKITLVRMPAFGVTCAPLNLACLAAVLRARGHDVTLLDLDAATYHEADADLRSTFWSRDTASNLAAWKDPQKVRRLASGPTTREWERRVLSGSPDVVGFSVYATNVVPTAHLARRIRRRSRAPIVFGGPHCRRESGVALDLVQRGFADAAVVGEGEETLAELVADLAAGGLRRRPGAIVRTARALEDGGPRASLADLDALPFPDFTGLRLEHYDALSAATSRGCINRCGFCLDCSFWGAHRQRRAERVAAELEHQVRTHGILRFELLDLLVNGRLPELERLCRLLVALGERVGRPVEWRGFLSPREMSADLLGLMRRAGCTHVSIGVESGSERVLRRFHRRTPTRTIEELVARCHAAGIGVGIDWMVGFPGETEEDFAATVALATRLRPYVEGGGHRPASLCAAPPGSDLYANPGRYGVVRLDATDLAGWDDGGAPYATRVARRRRLNEVLAQARASGAPDGGGS
jgi:radical SAM superfamily enzyme YgiQ (UPF0313 family)